MTVNYMDYTENNIEFRIVSSKMVERFKSTQSFVLSEMLYGEYKFSKSSREIVLLVMDTAFGWITSIEDYLIRDSVDIFDEKAKDFAVESLKRASQYALDTVTGKPEIFQTTLGDVWKIVHVKKKEIMFRALDECIGKRDLDAFSTISALLIEMLDSLKFELYEIDYLINDGSKPFLCLTDLNVYDMHVAGDNDLLFKANLYTEKFPIEKTFAIKNYSQEHNPIIYVSELEHNGYTVINKSFRTQRSK